MFNVGQSVVLISNGERFRAHIRAVSRRGVVKISVKLPGTGKDVPHPATFEPNMDCSWAHGKGVYAHLSIQREEQS